MENVEPMEKREPIVHVEQLSVSYHGETALDEVTFSASSQQLTGVIGPNGAGKSTLIKAIMGLIPINQGKITCWGRPVSKVRKHIAYVPQRNIIDFDFPVLVKDVVLMGRYPHLKWWQRARKQDHQWTEHCLEQVGMQDFSHRQIGELSGGQQQRVFIARALAQEAELFFLDEPFAGIDVTSETIIIDLLRQLRNEGKTLFVVHHDLSKVEEYFDHLLLLNKQLLGFGDKNEVFREELVSQAYSGNMTTIPHKEKDIVVVGS